MGTKNRNNTDAKTFHEFLKEVSGRVDSRPAWKRESVLTLSLVQEEPQSSALPPPTYVVTKISGRWHLIRTDGPRLVLGRHATKRGALLQGRVWARVAKGQLKVQASGGNLKETADYTLQ